MSKNGRETNDGGTKRRTAKKRVVKGSVHRHHHGIAAAGHKNATPKAIKVTPGDANAAGLYGASTYSRTSGML